MAAESDPPWLRALLVIVGIGAALLLLGGGVLALMFLGPPPMLPGSP
jgi:hypothetical protein